MSREYPPGNLSLVPLAQPAPPGSPAAGAASLEAIAQAHDPIMIAANPGRAGLAVDSRYVVRELALQADMPAPFCIEINLSLTVTIFKLTTFKPICTTVNLLRSFEITRRIARKITF